jgi:hypothetical protein
MFVILIVYFSAVIFSQSGLNTSERKRSEDNKANFEKGMDTLYFLLFYSTTLPIVFPFEPYVCQRQSTCRQLTALFEVDCRN